MNILKQTNEREFLFPVICCSVHLILDYSNFQSSLSRPRFCACWEESLRYLADGIRCESSGISRESKNKLEEKRKITQRNLETRISHLIIWFHWKIFSSGIGSMIGWNGQANNRASNRHDRKQNKDWVSRLSEHSHEVLFNLSFTCFALFFKTTGSIFLDSALCQPFRREKEAKGREKTSEITKESRVARCSRSAPDQKRRKKKLKIIKWEIGIWNRIWLITLPRSSFFGRVLWILCWASRMEPIDSPIIPFQLQNSSKWS